MFRNETNYVLTNGVLLDGTEKMTPQTGRDIYIEGGRISAVADATARREGYEVVDLGGQYVLPGLINLHVHLPASGKPKKKASDPKKLVKLITAKRAHAPHRREAVRGLRENRASQRRDDHPNGRRRGGF